MLCLNENRDQLFARLSVAPESTPPETEESQGRYHACNETAILSTFKSQQEGGKKRLEIDKQAL